MNPTSLELIATVLFGIAVLHTFCTAFFQRLAHRYPAHAGVFHLLGEVEVVFGFWALVLMLFMLGLQGQDAAASYLNTRHFTEPLFVFAIMVMAATKPILQMTGALTQALARWTPISSSVALYFWILFLVPLVGSLITEPAAMTLAALMLRDHFLKAGVSRRFQYLTLGFLFVNVSIGGTLTHFAAPPVLMVVNAWQWDTAFMLATFGWKASLAVLVNSLLVTSLLRRELQGVALAQNAVARVPSAVVLVHVLFLVALVLLAHQPVAFMGLFLFFLGFTTAYARYQDTLLLKEALLVAFFLAGLVVLGGLQAWWLQPTLLGMNDTTVFWGATALTAITDNAALTYLGSLVSGLSPEFKVALVQGAVTGGGLTLIANAPNPAGAAILRPHFSGQTIQPLGLLLAALVPTLIAVIAFRFL